MEGAGIRASRNRVLPELEQAKLRGRRLAGTPGAGFSKQERWAAAFWSAEGEMQAG
jgi:hypothetical protein